MGKAAKDRRDIFYRQAKEEGYRARSAYKLIQINEKFDIFNGVSKVVDLCSAPGSWSQVLVEKLIGCNSSNGDDGDVKIVAVDIQAQAAVPGVIHIQGDITCKSTADLIIEKFDGDKADLVVCDGAPDVTGLHDFDEFIQGQLLISALKISTSILISGGNFVAKIFRGKDVALLCSILEIFFGEVIIAKPRCSRNSSIESFVVCRSFKLPLNYEPNLFESFIEATTDEYFQNIDNPLQRKNLTFVACGESNLDADRTYSLELDTETGGKKHYQYSAPQQSPISPPYETACKLKKHGELRATAIE